MSVKMVLHCPKCNGQHVDRGKWIAKEHKKHLCMVCGLIWQPFDYPTVGVQYRDEASVRDQQPR